MNKWVYPESLLPVGVLLEAAPLEVWQKIFTEVNKIRTYYTYENVFDRLWTYSPEQFAAMFDPDNPIEDEELREDIANMFRGLFYLARNSDIKVPGVILQDVWDAVDGRMMEKGLVFWYYGYMHRDNPLFLARKADSKFPLNPDNFRRGLAGNIDPRVDLNPDRRSFLYLSDPKTEPGALGWSKKQLANAILDSGFAETLRLPWEYAPVINAPEMDRRLMSPQVRGLGLPVRMQDILSKEEIELLPEKVRFLTFLRWKDLPAEVKMLVPKNIATEMKSRILTLQDLSEHRKKLLNEMPVRRIPWSVVGIQDPENRTGYMSGFGHSYVMSGSGGSYQPIYFARIYQYLLNLGRNATPQQVMKWNIVPRERLLQIAADFRGVDQWTMKELAELPYDELLEAVRFRILNHGDILYVNPTSSR